MDSLAQVGVPGAFLVDLLLARMSTAYVSCVSKLLIDFVVKYVPQWFPGAGFQRKAARWRWVITALVDRPWKYVKDGLVCPPDSHHVQITYLAAVGWNSISMRHNGTFGRTTRQR